MAGEKCILIDSSKCCGCGSCYFSCKSWNSIPASGGSRITDGEFSVIRDIRPQNWLIVKRGADDGRLRAWPDLCRHCSDALCVKHCPVEAISNQDGWVTINRDICIGCGACETVCPYGAVSVYRGDSKGVLKKNRAYKCDGCSENYSEKPACVVSCPTGALAYGNRSRLIRKAMRRVKKLKKEYPETRLYGINEYKGQNVLFINMKAVEHENNDEQLGYNLLQVKTLYKTVSMFTSSFSVMSGHIYGFLHFIVTGKKNV
ncbi:MAG: 4Fe-4S dicluster domain-containing protein [Spirochaetes bacterium]|nr:4Fe-4S dicluster domain-containing protein [Spirochaetota bacterium]MBN2770007.1 4Fe-4S dicluster domain-containing protein [Spirochaetota bacterium]